MGAVSYLEISKIVKWLLELGAVTVPFGMGAWLLFS